VIGRAPDRKTHMSISMSRQRSLGALVVAVLVLAVLGVPALLRTRAGGAAQSSGGAVPDPVLAGAIDFHTHPAPDIQNRAIDALDLAKLARSRGMRGVVLKNHYAPTAQQAMLIRKELPGIEVFGGIALNRAVGGINPSAVEAMAHMTGGFGRVVWFPTQDADYRHEERGRMRGSVFAVIPLWRLHDDREDAGDVPYVSVARNGELLPEVKEVISIIAKHDLVLETGHSSPEESLLMVAEGRRQGVKHMLVTHAASLGWNAAQMQEAVKAGAYIEWIYTHILTDPAIERKAIMPTPEYAALLRKVGVDSAVMASEGGSAGNPLPPDGLTAFAAALAREGFTPAELARMMKENPAKLLGLPPL
jgi:hypothetical protein